MLYTCYHEVNVCILANGFVPVFPEFILGIFYELYFHVHRRYMATIFVTNVHKDNIFVQHTFLSYKNQSRRYDKPWA